MIMLVGAVAYFALPISQYPEVAPPSITVTASYPGANAETAAATVAAPLEQEINGVERMLYLSSQSTADGRTTITVTFALGTDLDAAQVLVQNRVNIALPRLPEEVRRLGVVTNKNTPDILMVVHIYSPDSSRDQLYLSNYTLLNIRDRLARLDGVGDLRLFGAREYSMRVWLDPNRISALGLTAGEVVQALRSQNVQVAGGVLDRPPSTQQGAYEVGVQLLGRLTDPAQFGDVLIKSADEGRLVRVRDVGRIELGAVDYSTNAYLDDKPAVAMPIFQRPGSNALETARGVQALMASLRPQFPTGLDYDIVYNPSEFIAESVREVQKTIFEAAILVVVVVVLFLQSWRASVIPLVAIPVSLIGTFAVLQAFGFSLNTLSLFGLVLAIGIVVDDAIVVVEDVERNLHEGMTPRDAARRTMEEVGGALVAIALVLSAVFVPTAFIPGISGQFYRQFALTIASATLISCLVSLTLSPALAALLLRPRSEARRVSRRPHRRQVLRWIQRGIRSALESVRHRRREDRARLSAGARRLRRAHRADRRAVLARARRLHPGAGPGLLHHDRAAATRAPRSRAPTPWCSARSRICARFPASRTRRASPGSMRPHPPTPATPRPCSSR